MDGSGVMIGELRCLNCSRHLADVVDVVDGRPRLEPPAGRSTTPVLVRQTAGGLRCARCGGRPMLEAAIGIERAATRRTGRSTGINQAA
jgi:hypothetical protein